tara:strand:- start:482 stop:1015 length:534 start_codon:yes stop_codon:yes gene_type:complete
MKIIILVILTILISPYNSFGETKTIQTTGFVHSVEVLKKFTTKQVPKREKICEIKKVPVNETNQKFGADNLIGALIGGAIGNQLGKGGGKQGSTAIGAIIGSEIVRNDKNAKASNGKFIEKEICRLQRIVHTETIEQIYGYKLSVEIDGELINIQSNRSYNPGDTISIRKRIIYSIF